MNNNINKKDKGSMERKKDNKKMLIKGTGVLVLLLLVANYKTIEGRINHHFYNKSKKIGLIESESKTGDKKGNIDGKDKTEGADEIGNQEKQMSKYSSNKILVSNLKGKMSKDDLKRVLDKAKIDPKRQEQLFRHIEQFNGLDASSNLIGPYKKIATDQLAFDEFKLQNSWEKAHKDFDGYNCRITSMSILADYININKDSKPVNENTNLEIDINSLSQDPSGLTSKDDMDKFKKMYATLKVENTKDKSKMIAAQKKYWDSIGFNVTNNIASLVTVHFHTHFSETENELFVGHTGILFEDGSDYYFFEKLAFQAPYRLVKLSSKQELKTYLLDKYMKLRGQDDAEPFVAINGKAI